MKYYDEDRMSEVRKALEAKVMKWPGVAGREMMGCLCYFRGSKFFAFLVTDGIVITKLSETDRTRLADVFTSKPFEMAGKTSRSWVTLKLTKASEVPRILPYIRTSYEAASDR